MDEVKIGGRMNVDLRKVEALAKKSHSSCKGVGTIGRRRGTTDVVICPCVHRRLRTMGVDYRDSKQIGKAIGVDPPPPPADVPGQAAGTMEEA